MPPPDLLGLGALRFGFGTGGGSFALRLEASRWRSSAISFERRLLAKSGARLRSVPLLE